MAGAPVPTTKTSHPGASKYVDTNGTTTMGELVSLRKARKQAKQEADAKRAAANRLLHGRSKAERSLDAARAEQRHRHLEAHKIDTGEG